MSTGQQPTKRHKGNDKQYESKAEQMAGAAVACQPHTKHRAPLPCIGCVSSSDTAKGADQSPLGLWEGDVH